MRCPHCSHKIGIFSSAWQRQRAQEVKHCPYCNTPLEVAFATPRFAAWFAVVAIIAMVVLRALGMPVLLALPVSALAAFNAGLIASMHLRIAPDPALAEVPGNVSAVYPPRAPVSTVRMTGWLATGYVVIALLSFAIFVAGVAIWVPEPWSAIVLLAAGALCMWKRRVQIASFRIDGLPAQIYAGGLLLGGVLLVLRFLDI